MVSKMIDDLYRGDKLGGFNQNQMRDIFQGFIFEIMNAFCG